MMGRQMGLPADLYLRRLQMIFEYGIENGVGQEKAYSICA